MEEKSIIYGTLEGGLEPPTLWLTATRSNQLSYSSLHKAFWTGSYKSTQTNGISSYKANLTHL